MCCRREDFEFELNTLPERRQALIASPEDISEPGIESAKIVSAIQRATVIEDAVSNHWAADTHGDKSG
jgi:hypothetical protein